MINLSLRAQQVLFPRLIRPMPAHQIPILLRLQQRYKMNAPPHFLARQLTTRPSEIRILSERIHCVNEPPLFPKAGGSKFQERACKGEERREGIVVILLLPDPLSHLVEPVAHDGYHAEEVIRGAKAPGRQVALVVVGKLAA